MEKQVELKEPKPIEAFLAPECVVARHRLVIFVDNSKNNQGGNDNDLKSNQS